MKGCWGVGAIVVCLIAVSAGSVSPASSAIDKTCKPFGTLVGTTVHFCGPAKATLSAFPGVTFTHGTCSTKHSGSVVFTLKMGSRTQDAKNSGLPFFAITITGSIAHPTGGVVTAYSKGKLWLGVGTSFKGTAMSGSFSARATNGSNAKGTFHC